MGVLQVEAREVALSSSLHKTSDNGAGSWPSGSEVCQLLEFGQSIIHHRGTAKWTCLPASAITLGVNNALLLTRPEPDALAESRGLLTNRQDLSSIGRNAGHVSWVTAQILRKQCRRRAIVIGYRLPNPTKSPFSRSDYCWMLRSTAMSPCRGQGGTIGEGVLDAR